MTLMRRLRIVALNDQSIDIDVAFSDIVRVLLMFYADLFAV